MRLSQIMREAGQVKIKEQTGIARAAGGPAEVEQIYLKDRGTVEQKLEGFKKIMSALGPTEDESPELKRSSPAFMIQKGNRGKMMLHVPPPTRPQKRGIKDAIATCRLARGNFDHREMLKSIETEFVFQVIRAGIDIGVAVLNLVPEVPEVEDTPDQMITVKPESIEFETNLDFEVFLHLLLNGRYVRYVREGGKMSRGQSSRLTQHT